VVKLSRLVAQLGGSRTGAADPELSDVHLDSRRVGPGALFAALPGTRSDGARHVEEALRRGAAAVLSPAPLGSAQAPGWIHPEARRIAGEAAALVHGGPGAGQRIVGITGTNGKSTVAHLARHLLERAGARPALVGTIAVQLWSEAARPATHTTPDGPELQRLCARNRALGGDSLALEVSSHALDQDRLAGLWLDAAVFTNLGRDHLDYHRTLEAYAAAKERIFARLKPDGTAVINADDPAAQRMERAARRAQRSVVTYGTRSHADLSATLAEASPAGTHLFLEGMGIPRTGFFLPLVGRHNVENALAALAAVLSLGASPSLLLQGLASASLPSGRLERLGPGGARGLEVFVDYAHTPDALLAVLATLRELAGKGRLLVVFGCGGERDREKRGPMGEAVGRLADLAFATSDNPRGEDPAAILADVRAGLERGTAGFALEPDRRTAIARALNTARSGDIVLIAGKGHEAWQELGNRRIPFDDRRVALEELAR
jgi:UDP-N-acetylmuramoyl-L-alanyl-D-glutamate--2,6-diaminopimelate ligase